MVGCHALLRGRARIRAAVPDKVIVLRSRPPSAEIDERAFRIRYAEVLNAQQFAAVTHREGPLLVIAGAGSGKTRTLIYRVARLIESGVPPGAILLLTFTRRAAQEMLRRVEQLIGDRGGQVAGGTFHSFANQVLRQMGGAIGLKPNFTILDRGDVGDVINLLRARLDLGSKDRRFPKKGTIAEAISMARNKNRALAAELESDFPHLLEHAPALGALADKYDEYKRERGLLDYDDLLYRLSELLTTDAAVRQRLSATYRHVMIDEYQDTNLIQAELVRLLAMTHQNVMAVGDDAQSIYAFRGANFRNIMDFPAIFPGARVIKLEENYRSLQGILDVANEVISRASEKYTKALFTQRSGELRPTLVRAADEHMQSRFVAQRVLELREEGVALNEIAVLFRSSFHSFDLELELQRRDIPFVKRGGFKFIETAHVKDVLAHLRVIANPADAISWMRTLVLVDGVGNRRAQRLVEEIVTAPAPEEALARGAAANIGGRGQAAAQGCARLAQAARASARQSGRPADQLAEVVEYYLPIMRDGLSRTTIRSASAISNISRTWRNATAVSNRCSPTWRSNRRPIRSATSCAVDPEEGYVTLSTIHSAKGLEWRVVFLIWAADGRFPGPMSVRPEELEEERRLMYVASTRARDEFYISYPIYMIDRQFGHVMGRVSRFLEDLDPQSCRPRCCRRTRLNRNCVA